MYNQIQIMLIDQPIAEARHLGKFPGSINVQQGEWYLSRSKCFAGKMQHDRRILTNRIAHAGIIEAGGHFSHDMNTFGFQLLKMVERFHFASSH
jgi:hypothetical protein